MPVEIEKDFSQIQNYIIQVLPQLLRQQPEIVTTIEGIVAHQFPRRDEFARMFEEVKLLREDMHRRFEQTDRRLDLVERHLEQTDQRLEKMDRRIELVEQRLEKIEQRIELVEERLEKMDRRIDLVEQRLEKMDRRIELVEQRLELLREEMNQRFDKQHQEILGIKRHLIKVESTLERMENKITKFDAWLKIIAGNVGDEKGQALEQLFALGLTYGLKNRDVKPETIQLRQQFVDTEGLIYLKKGKYIEVDIIAEDGMFTVFEVKSSAVGTDVETFARKVKLIQIQNLDKQVQGIFISLGAKDEVKQCCQEYDLELID
jgi:hypothetical protein